MHVTKCDICKKNLESFDQIILVGLGWDRKELCLNYGLPVTKFLSVSKLVAKAEVDKLYK